MTKGGSVNLTNTNVASSTDSIATMPFTILQFTIDGAPVKNFEFTIYDKNGFQYGSKVSISSPNTVTLNIPQNGYIKIITNTLSFVFEGNTIPALSIPVFYGNNYPDDSGSSIPGFTGWSNSNTPLPRNTTIPVV